MQFFDREVCFFCWIISLRLRSAPPDRTLCPSRMTALEQSIKAFHRNCNGATPSIFHICRSLNGIAHDCAHQLLNSLTEPVFACGNQADWLCMHADNCELCLVMIRRKQYSTAMHKVRCQTVNDHAQSSACSTALVTNSFPLS